MIGDQLDRPDPEPATAQVALAEAGKEIVKQVEAGATQEAQRDA